MVYLYAANNKYFFIVAIASFSSTQVQLPIAISRSIVLIHF